ncbi:MAG: putative membrane protein [Spirosomataceae bacterium]|jgi:uncharacterized membrane protein
MAANSASCKNYCITLVTALLALAFGQNENTKDMLYLAFVPTTLFLFLDAYYLSLEEHFRKEYGKTVESWQMEKLTRTDLFTVNQSAEGTWRFVDTLKAFASYSIYPFYSALYITVGFIIYKL